LAGQNKRAAPQQSTKPEEPVGGDFIGATQRTTQAIMRIVQIVALIGFLTWIVVDFAFIKDWLRGLTHAEAFGVKIDRRTVDSATQLLQQLSAKKPSEFDKAIGDAALRRSIRVAPAIVDANVLWVDDEPKNNDLPRQFLETLHVRVTIARSTEEAMRALKRMPFDLIISDVWRPNDPRVELQRCKIHYFDYPNDQLRKEYEKPGGGGLERFNLDSNSKGPAGFSMAEQIAPKDDDMVPPIIFYAADSAIVVRSLCGVRVINRTDTLLQNVVSLLEEQRWKRLEPRD